MKLLSAALIVAFVSIVVAPAATAAPEPRSGCSTPPCGAVQNKADRKIQVRWSNHHEAWKYKWVSPGHTAGGYWNDGLDIDFWEAPARCDSTWHFSGSNNKHVAKGGWVKLESSQTAVVTSIRC